MSLRPYQEALIAGTRSAFASGSRRLLIASPTGSGKTFTGATIAQRFHQRSTGRILWLAHREELLTQARAALSALRLNPGLIASTTANPAPNSRVQVASVNTAARRDLGSFDLVIIDEAHRSSASSYQAVIEDTRPIYLIGLTATPARTDGKPLGEVYDALLVGPSVHELVEQGHLSPVRYYAAPFHLEQVRRTAGDYNRKDLAAAMTRSTLVGDMVETWTRHAHGRSTIAFASGVEHAEMIAERFRSAGVRAESLSGSTPKAERADLIQRLASGDLTLLANAEVLIEGVDVPRVSCVVAARPTMSAIIYRQAIGRGLRLHPGKADCIVLDHAGWVAQHGHIYEHIEWTLEGKQAARRAGDPYPVWTCPDCYRVHEGHPSDRCPDCDWERPAASRSGPDEVAGELVEVAPSAPRVRPPKGWVKARAVRSKQVGQDIELEWEVMDDPHAGYVVQDTLRGEGKAKGRILHLLRAIGHRLPDARVLQLEPTDLIGTVAYIEVGRYQQRASITYAGYRRA